MKEIDEWLDYIASLRLENYGQWSKGIFFFAEKEYTFPDSENRSELTLYLNYYKIAERFATYLCLTENGRFRIKTEINHKEIKEHFDSKFGQSWHPELLEHLKKNYDWQAVFVKQLLFHKNIPHEAGQIEISWSKVCFRGNKKAAAKAEKALKWFYKKPKKKKPKKNKKLLG